MARDKIQTNDRQLACARINSQEGQDYLKAMACAANFAWVNRSSMTFLVRQAFAKMFHTTPDDLDMHLVYDVSHNIAKVRDLQVVHPPGLQVAYSTLLTLGSPRSEGKATGDVVLQSTGCMSTLVRSTRLASSDLHT